MALYDHFGRTYTWAIKEYLPEFANLTGMPIEELDLGLRLVVGRP